MQSEMLMATAPGEIHCQREHNALLYLLLNLEGTMQ